MHPLMMPGKVHSNRVRERPGNVLVAVVLATSLLSGCEDAPAPPPATPEPAATTEWPADGVIAMGATVIHRAEVEEVADWIATFLPGQARNSHRRKAFTGLLLERAALADGFPAARTQARTAAEAFAASAQAGSPDPSVTTTTLTGYWSDVGLMLWGRALDQPVDTWSAPIETDGAFVVQRVAARHDGTTTGETRFTLELARFPYTPPAFDRAAFNALLTDTRMTVIDPEFGGLVPATWRYTITSGQ